MKCCYSEGDGNHSVNQYLTCRIGGIFYQFCTSKRAGLSLLVARLVPPYPWAARDTVFFKLFNLKSLTLHISNNFHTECSLPLPKAFDFIFFYFTFSNICLGHALRQFYYFLPPGGLAEALQF